MHIDLYSIILFQVSTILLVYLIAIPINRIGDESIKNELKKLRSDYDGAIGLGDIIVWPIILTLFFPFYALFILLFKRKLWLLLRIITNSKRLAVSILLILATFFTLVVFAAFHYFLAYAIVFIPSVLVLIVNYKREKSEYEGN